MMAVILKVNNLNCRALKFWELKFYVVFIFASVMCKFKTLKFEICITDVSTPCIIESNEWKMQFSIKPVLQNRLLSAL